MNIKPVSDLRNYNEILRNCNNGEPVFLTKNGHGRYVLLDISELAEAENSIKNRNDYLSLDEVKTNLRVL